MEYISEGIFWKIFINEDFGFILFFNGQILMPFSGLASQNWKLFKKKLRVGYVYIEESFETMDYGSGKSAMDERVNELV